MKNDVKVEGRIYATLLWIIEKLERRPMTFKELSAAWASDPRWDEVGMFCKRTFGNHKQKIAEVFGMDVECDRYHRYYTTGKMSQTVRRIMDDFAQAMLLQDNLDLAPRLLLEEYPVAGELLEDCLQAMRENRRVRFVYEDFGEPSRTIVGCPYCMKSYERRWYLVVHDDEGHTQPYCLDRMRTFDLLDERFTLPADFSPKEFFRYTTGVRVPEGDEPVTVSLWVDAAQMPYLRALPLHASQREVETTEEGSVVELYVVPTIELTMKLCGMSDLVEVLAPRDLRREVADRARWAASLYDDEDDEED